MSTTDSLFETYGPITEKDFVRFNTICRQYGLSYNDCRVLRRFTHVDDAIQSFDRWRQESKKMKTVKEYKFNLSIRLSPKDVEDIIREKIARDNPGVDPESIYMEDVTEGSYDEKEYDGYVVEWRNK